MPNCTHCSSVEIEQSMFPSSDSSKCTGLEIAINRLTSGPHMFAGPGQRKCCNCLASTDDSYAPRACRHCLVRKEAGFQSPARAVIPVPIPSEQRPGGHKLEKALSLSDLKQSIEKYGGPLAAAAGGWPEVHISVYFEEAKREAKALRNALLLKQITAFLDPTEGSGAPGRVWGDILDNIEHCKVVVVLATATYGKETHMYYDTRGELAQIVRRKKPMVLIRMCDQYHEEYASSTLAGYEYIDWSVGAPMPPRVLEVVKRELKDAE